MKRLLYWLGLVDLVWTEDFNGAIRLRIVWTNPEGHRFVYSILGPFFSGHNLSELMDDGKLKGGATYMERWYPFDQYPRHKPMHLSMWKLSARLRAIPTNRGQR